MLATLKATATLTTFVIVGVGLGTATDVAIGPDSHITLATAGGCVSVMLACTWKISQYVSKQKVMHHDNLAKFDRQDERAKKQEEITQKQTRLINQICHKLGIHTDSL